MRIENGFIYLFILQAIYIVLQDLKMKMLFVKLNISLQEQNERERYS